MAVELVTNNGFPGTVFINGLPYQKGTLLPNWSRRGSGYIRIVQGGTDHNLVLDWTHYEDILGNDDSFDDFNQLRNFIAANFYVDVSGGANTNSKFPVAQDAYIMTKSTNNDGTLAFFASRTCNALDIHNDTGVDIAYMRGTDANKWIIPVGETRMVVGITNADQVGVQRATGAGSSVVVTAEALTF